MSPEFPKYVNLSESRVESVNVGTASTLLLRPNPNRISITFPPSGTNRYSIFPRAVASIDRGITFRSTSNPYTMTVWEHGDLVRGEWYAISDTAAQDVDIFITEAKQ